MHRHPEILKVVDGYNIEQVTAGQSGAQVQRLHGKTGAADLYLKSGRGRHADAIVAEAARLQWLSGHISVPEIIRHGRSGDAGWLLTSALKGESAYAALEAGATNKAAVVDKLALFLRQIHSISANSCPFDSNHNARLVSARENIDASLVDVDDFDEARLGWTAEQVWSRLQEFLPMNVSCAVTHGDYSLDNVFVHEGEVSGCIDVGKVGLADPYQDIAIMWNCLGEFGSAAQDRFLAAYGILNLDRDKLEFHLLLDELF